MTRWKDVTFSYGMLCYYKYILVMFGCWGFYPSNKNGWLPFYCAFPYFRNVTGILVISKTSVCWLLKHYNAGCTQKFIQKKKTLYRYLSCENVSHHESQIELSNEFAYTITHSHFYWKWENLHIEGAIACIQWNTFVKLWLYFIISTF